MAALKSSAEALSSRGFLDDAAFEALLASGAVSAPASLGAAEPRARTATARLIRQERRMDCIPALINALRAEKKLYAKLELCEALAAFGEASAPLLVPLIGTIGDNRHAVAGSYDLGKRSYPLPRDIAARVLVRIGPAGLPYLSAALATADEAASPEIVDAIGHIAWNYRDESLGPALLSMYRGAGDVLLRWKLIRAFRSFSLPGIRTALLEVRDGDGEPDALRVEAAHSLRLIGARNGDGNAERGRDGEESCVG